MRKIDKIGDNVLLYFGDCLEEMDKIPDKSIDMILCDLPYGTTACKWDTVIPFEPLWAHYKRVIKRNGAIVLFGSEPFSSALRTSNLGMYKYDWKWEKDSGANFLSFKYQPAKVHEDIMVFGQMAVSFSKNGTMKYFPQMWESTPYSIKSGMGTGIAGPSARADVKSVLTENKGERYPRSIIKFNRGDKRFHSTQKPVALLEYLIRTYTNNGETVLDNCMGSGSTGVACVNTGRRFIGIELDENYYNISKKRIEEALHIVCE